MHPELYLVLYRQQERELEASLRRRLLQTCCAALDSVRSRRASLVGRLTALARPRTAPALLCCA
jgi:hypothetical protein